MCSSNDWGEFYLFLMTFPLDFDLLMIGVCTFIQKKKTTKKQKQNKNKNKKTKKKKKKCKDMFVSHILLHLIFFVVGFISGGLSEIFFFLMRDELRESSLRSFIPWIMTNMYLI